MESSLFLALAAAKAEKFVGRTSPNPPVGAALVRDGRLLAIGAHAKAGEDHAEIVALKRAFAAHGAETVRGSTIYVTLEPCNHFGRTPPCTRALLEAGVARVVFAEQDPNPAVTGAGAQTLKAAGLDVVHSRGHEACQRLLDGFRKRSRLGRPWVTLKRAYRLTEDGALTMRPETGHKTFTSPESLKAAHLERRRSDAIITGRATVLADNPLFNVRHVPDHPGKRRLIVVVTRSAAPLPEPWLKAQESVGHETLLAKSCPEALDELGRRGVLRALVEAGPTLSDLFETERLWDEKMTFVHREPDDLFHKEFACSRES